MKFKSSPRSLHIRWSVNPKNHPMKHLPLCYSFERLMDMDSLVFTYPQRSAVNEAETCTFAPKHLLDEQGQWDGYLFSNSTKRLYETTLGKRWRIYFHIFPDKNILDNDIPNHKKYHDQHDFCLWQGWSTGYVHFTAGLNVYFVIIASKNLQKPSAIQNNSITLHLVIIAIIVCNPL